MAGKIANKQFFKMFDEHIQETFLIISRFIGNISKSNPMFYFISQGYGIEHLQVVDIVIEQSSISMISQLSRYFFMKHLTI